MGETAVWILFGSLLWTVFATLLMFDMLLAFFALLGASALVRAAQGRAVTGFGLLALALGLGMLAKGPVILVHVLPAALLAPWWMKPVRRPLWRWYAGIAAAAGLAAVVMLIWALPAAYAGGNEYAREILWGQSARRMVASFAHRHPPWWYLPWLPLVLFPWLAWPALWRGWRRLPRALADDPGVRFLVAWLAPAFVVLSSISGKQLHYLLPLVPAFALLSAYGLRTQPVCSRRADMRWPAAALVATGGGGGGLYLAFSPSATAFYAGVELPAWPFLSMLILGALLALFAASRGGQAVRFLSVASLLAVIVVHTGLIPRFAPYYDPAPLAAYLAQHERAGQPIAHVGQYHGQYHFAGRLERPFVIVEETELRDWLYRHPEGKAIFYRPIVPHREQAGSNPFPDHLNRRTRIIRPDYAQAFRGGIVVVLSRDAILAMAADR